MIGNQHYPFSLPPLPYSYNALEPYIDAETMYYHHDKHFKTYIDNLNNTLKNYPQYQNRTLESLLICLNELPQEIQAAVRNNGGGVYNHDLYFDIMTPYPKKYTPDFILKEFGGIDSLKSKLKASGLNRFGSGFSWLAIDCDGKLQVLSLPNQDNPLTLGMYPLLALDVWEHAYYLKYKNERDTYIDNWFSTVDWEGLEAHYMNMLKTNIHYCGCNI